MKSLKKILAVLLIATMMVVVSNVVFATENDPVYIIDEANNTVANNTSNTSTTNSLFNNNTITNKTTVNNTTNNVVNTTTNSVNRNSTNTTKTNSSTYNNNSNLPKAGSSDSFVVIAIIIAFAVLAMYAYKKIRDYNLK